MIDPYEKVLCAEGKRITGTHKPFECPFCKKGKISINPEDELDIIVQKNVQIKENGNKILVDIIYCQNCENILSINPK